MPRQEAIHEAKTREIEEIDRTHFAFIISSPLIWKQSLGENSLFATIIDACSELGIKTVTLNLPEQSNTMSLGILATSMNSLEKAAKKRGMEFLYQGPSQPSPESRNGLPTVLVRFAPDARAELVRVAQKIVASGINPEEIDEQALSTNLDMPELTDPYGIIFIGPEYAESIRFNNELNWRMSYAELATIPLPFNEITKEDIKDKIRRCLERQQNFGGRAVV